MNQLPGMLGIDQSNRTDNETQIIEYSICI